MGEMVDAVVHLLRRQFASPVRCALGLAESGATGATPEETALFRAIELFEPDVVTP